MNYRHAYHAGNFADVIKHVCLIRLLQALQRKPKPYCYFETHAGAGAYGLEAGAALKTREYESGIGRLWRTRQSFRDSDGIGALLRVVEEINGGDDTLRHYPGSPWIARALAREGDRLIFGELHREEATMLRRALGGDARVHVHQRDGYELAGAVLPPVEKRGLVFVDPPYEEADEFARLPQRVAAAVSRWPSGIYALWYPLKDAAAVATLKRRVVGTGIRRVLVAELEIAAPGAQRLYGSGVMFVNPPWQLDDELTEDFNRLAPLLATGTAARRVGWLVPE